jgi:hypothetical protein
VQRKLTFENVAKRGGAHDIWQFYFLFCIIDGQHVENVLCAGSDCERGTGGML